MVEQEWLKGASLPEASQAKVTDLKNAALIRSRRHVKSELSKYEPVNGITSEPTQQIFAANQK